MCDTGKLKGKIIEKGFTQLSLAEKVNINRSTLSRKLRNGDTFTVGEVSKMIEALELSKDEMMIIFFGTNVA